MEKKDFSNFRKKTFIKVLFVLGVFLSLYSFSYSATITFSPNSITKNVGDTFPIEILVSSPETINATDLLVSFPREFITLKNVSNTKSIIDFYPNEPTFSNGTGEMNLEGVIFNPGFVGAGGNLITLEFVAKKAGVSNVSIKDVTVYANDGLATELSTTSSIARIEIKVPEIIEEPEPEEVLEPEKPEPIAEPNIEAEPVIMVPTSLPVDEQEIEPNIEDPEPIRELDLIDIYSAEVGKSQDAFVCKSDMLLLAIFILLVIIVVLLLVLFFEINQVKKEKKRNETYQ